MTVGHSVATLNAILLAQWNGDAWVGVLTPFVKLHTGDPGSAGTANASAETAFKALTFGAASGGSITSDEVIWTPWTVGAETITHVSFWTDDLVGVFYASGALPDGRNLTNGDAIGITVTATHGPLAA